VLRAALTGARYGDSASEEFEATLNGRPDGLHSVWVRVSDVAGNQQADGLSSDTFRVDTVGLTILYAALERTTTCPIPVLLDYDEALF